VALSFLPKKRLGWILSDRNSASLLVLDVFKGHKDKQGEVAKIARALDKNHIHLAWVPGGCTPLVQPLDVAINRPFKAALGKLWRDWMNTEIENAQVDRTSGYHSDDEEAAPRIRPPSKQQIVSWVEEAWYAIASGIVQKSFVCTGISNALDGSEDDLKLTFVPPLLP